MYRKFYYENEIAVKKIPNLAHTKLNEPRVYRTFKFRKQNHIYRYIYTRYMYMYEYINTEIEGTTYT